MHMLWNIFKEGSLFTVNSSAAEGSLVTVNTSPMHLLLSRVIRVHMRRVAMCLTAYSNMI